MDLQPPSTGIGAATLNRLKRISIMRGPSKPRTIGSGSEFDAMLADSGLTRASLSLDMAVSPTQALDKGQVDENGNKILGGELVVKVWEAQVGILPRCLMEHVVSIETIARLHGSESRSAQHLQGVISTVVQER